MYTIKSVSDEGVYYLVKGWEKHKTFWVRKHELTPDMLFKNAASAKRSLTMLLKNMSEYNTDIFSVVEVTSNEIRTISEYKLPKEEFEIVINDDFESILVCAVRYAYGRSTYMPHVLCSYISPLISKISTKTLNVILRDIGGYSDLSDFNNKNDWKMLYCRIVDELNKRE